MAKLARVHQKQFGVNAGASDVGVFGSLAAASPAYSKDPAIIQSLAAFLTGWAAETIANNRPALEDFNALDFLSFYQLCYLFESGVPEWIATTTYYTGSIVNDGSGVLYKSLVDDNLNNAVTDGTKWELVVNVGTGANQLVQLDGDAKLPAVDGSLLTGITQYLAKVEASGEITSPTGSMADMTTMTITYTPTQAVTVLLLGKVKIYAAWNGNTTRNGSAQLLNGSTVIDSSNYTSCTGGGLGQELQSGASLQSIQVLTANTAYTFKVQWYSTNTEVKASYRSLYLLKIA